MFSWVSNVVSWFESKVVEPIKEFVEDVIEFVVDVWDEVVDWFSPDLPDSPSRDSAISQRERIQQFRESVTPHRLVYGEFRLSGPLTFVETSGDNTALHLVITLAAHPVEAIEDIYFGDTVIPSDTIDSTTGIVNTGIYANKARIFKSLGDEGAAQPFPALVSATTAWTSNHLQRNRAKIYVRLT